MLREGIRALSEPWMETEVAGIIDAARHERSGVPLSNGTPKWETQMSMIGLAISRSRGAPNLRPGASNAARHSD